MRRVLFVCARNACRSQMAEAWARALAAEPVLVSSAGSRAGGRVDPRALAAMREAGVDARGARSKGIDDIPVLLWDAVVGMGCGESLGPLPARRRVEWPIPDPQGGTPEAYARARDEIGRRVRALLVELGIRLRPS